MRPIDAIAQRLVQKGIGTVGSTGTIFVGSDAVLPVLPASQVLVTVLETGGEPALRLHTGGKLRRPHFQITMRHARYPDAAAKADAAYNALGGDDNDSAGMVNVLIGDVFFLICRPMQEPFGMPSDANGRARVTFNVETTVRRG